MAGIVLIAGGGAGLALTLALAMLGIQVSIGAVNDLADEGADARAKPWKPIPSGLVSRRTAAVVAVSGGVVGLALSALHGPAVLALAVVMYGGGLTYDLLLKPTALAWLPYAVAFPLLPIYAWLAAAGTLPPRPELLLPIAALAGPTLQLANGLVDAEEDAAEGSRGPVVLLGRSRATAALVVLVGLVHGIAWATLVGRAAPGSALVVAAFATVLAALGVRWSGSAAEITRERGFQAQALALVLLGGSWLLASRD